MAPGMPSPKKTASRPSYPPFRPPNGLFGGEGSHPKTNRRRRGGNPASCRPTANPPVHRPRSAGLFCVIHHPLKVDDHDVLFPDHPGIMSGRQERHIARFAHEFRSIIHHDFQGPCYVVLEVGCLTTRCLCDWVNGLGPTPSRLQGGTPDGRSADRYQLPFALGEDPYFIGLAEAFLFRFPWHILIPPMSVR